MKCSTVTEKGLQLLNLTLRQIEIVPGAIRVATGHRLLRLRQVGAHVAPGGDHVSPQTQAITMHLLFQSIEAAFNRSGAALQVIAFRFDVVE